jgi:hypothetical protein
MHQIRHLFARFDLRDPLMYGPAPTQPCASHDFGRHGVAGRFSRGTFRFPPSTPS